MIFRAALAWVFTALYWTALSFIQALAFRRLPAFLVQKGARVWGRTTLKILGIKLTLIGQSTVEDRAARVLVFNHQSALDIIWMAAILPPAALTIGKKELIWIPFINLGWWFLGFLRIDRSRPRMALAALAGVPKEVARNRRSLIIAPEGTRTRDGSVGPFKRGAFRFAMQSRAPVCPVAVSGAYELLPRNKFLPRRGEIRLEFLPPVDTESLGESGLDELSGRVRGLLCRSLAAKPA